MKLYGIPHCGTVKKARAWLTENGIEVPFHAFKKTGVSEEFLKCWLKQIDWEQLVNRRGTTWRQLPDDAKTAVRDEARAIRLMIENSSVIKRPVLEIDGNIILGFDEAAYQSIFGIN